MECILSDLIGLFESERREADDYRKSFENVWVSGYYAFNSQYESTAGFRPNGSRVYYGLTRVKCLAAHAREMDILTGSSKGQIPWSIEPTPDADVPIKKVVNFIIDKLPPELQQQVAVSGPEALMDIVPKEVFEKAEQALAVSSMRKMTRHIEDAMVEDKTLIKVRNGMLEKTITGTCVFKFGVCERSLSNWAATTDGFEYAEKSEQSPSVKNVSVFDIWFDPNAQLLVDNGTIQSCEYVYERYRLVHSELLGLADKSGFNAEAIRSVLREGPNDEETPASREQREMWGGATSTAGKAYDVYERTGFLTAGQLQEGGIQFDCDLDPVEQLNMSVWYCGDKIIKAVQLPYKATNLPYMVVPQERAPGQLYGVGIPWKMRHGQALLNSAIRLYIDCKANASGPIAAYNADTWNNDANLEDMIFPWACLPFEVPAGKSVRDIFDFKAIPDVSTGLQGLIEMAKHQCDEESQVPAFSHAAQSKSLMSSTGGTASGMAMILSMADLSHKMAVQNIDDFFTVPCITMYYNWFMQYGEDEDAKGDLKVQALGTIGVMKKELMAQRLTQLITQTSNPVDSQIINRQQLWFDTLDAYDLDIDKYMTQGMEGAPAGAPPQAPPGMPQTGQGPPPGLIPQGAPNVA